MFTAERFPRVHASVGEPVRERVCQLCAKSKSRSVPTSQRPNQSKMDGLMKNGLVGEIMGLHGWTDVGVGLDFWGGWVWGMSEWMDLVGWV